MKMGSKAGNEDAIIFKGRVAHNEDECLRKSNMQEQERARENKKRKEKQQQQQPLTGLHDRAHNRLHVMHIIGPHLFEPHDRLITGTVGHEDHNHL